MRVLFTTYPQKTHFLMMAPLAWALRTAGHEVAVASQAHFAGVITQAGHTAVPVGRDHGFWRMIDLHPDWLGTGGAGLPDPYDSAMRPASEVGWDDVHPGLARQVERWHRMVNFPMTADLVAFAREWRPDLVVWEPTTYAGAVAARACGAAHARLMWSLDVFGVTRDHFLRLARPGDPDPLAAWLGPYTEEFGEDLAVGDLTVHQLPGSLRVEAATANVSMRYVPYGGPATVPSWLREPPARPRVALTLGLSLTDADGGYVVDVQDVLDHLGTLDVEVVATLAAHERERLARVPANTRLVGFTPLHALAPTCAAVVHHAGPGTLSTTALHAVPQLALPHDFDEPALAARLAAQGAGLTLPAGEATGADVRAAVERLLAEPSFAARAADLRDEMLALPTPNQLVPRLEELARSR
ncbi:activator-dependent family glycosyltransferase [Herbidospora galbida]|uniref:Activator-dependent family glycosyltransferase n=1 Tax=Herbidospora galbida TaxID=2575442 RepID=A0A4U3MHA2_9ACTN|nr:activator-dependent family glycosyltransferase [Herbidospora galbida]TKK87226.1 activator-dependent family glycosyltransferase [Herbidospora galbida]